MLPCSGMLRYDGAARDAPLSLPGQGEIPARAGRRDPEEQGGFRAFSLFPVQARVGCRITRAPASTVGSRCRSAATTPVSSPSEVRAAPEGESPGARQAFAGVAQWQSICLPSRVSRVRFPLPASRDRSSVVERCVANAEVTGSSPVGRFPHLFHAHFPPEDQNTLICRACRSTGRTWSFYLQIRVRAPARP